MENISSVPDVWSSMRYCSVPASFIRRCFVQCLSIMINGRTRGSKATYVLIISVLCRARVLLTLISQANCLQSQSDDMLYKGKSILTILDQIDAQLALWHVEHRRRFAYHLGKYVFSCWISSLTLLYTNISETFLPAFVRYVAHAKESWCTDRHLNNLSLNRLPMIW